MGYWEYSFTFTIVACIWFECTGYAAAQHWTSIYMPSQFTVHAGITAGKYRLDTDVARCLVHTEVTN